ncbi:MAG: ATP synthase F1 subunit delta [Kiritimatiellae bacterium]|nr:ATP synthase F1 subunit delta [Kiritimatiellia bacterium]
MNANNLAERYGYALLALAEEQGIHHRVVVELNALLALIAREPQLKACLNNPTIPVPAKQAILDELMAPECCLLTRNFVGLLIRNRRETLLADVAWVLEARLREDEGLIAVKLMSALPMTDSDQADFVRRLSQWLNKKVELEIKVMPELLAGIMIRIGDHLIDGSCRGQLIRMRQVLMS